MSLLTLSDSIAIKPQAFKLDPGVLPRVDQQIKDACLAGVKSITIESPEKHDNPVEWIRAVHESLTARGFQVTHIPSPRTGGPLSMTVSGW